MQGFKAQLAILVSYLKRLSIVLLQLSCHLLLELFQTVKGHVPQRSEYSCIYHTDNPFQDGLIAWFGTVGGQNDGANVVFHVQ
jgi:hypothetical protein